MAPQQSYCLLVSDRLPPDPTFDWPGVFKRGDVVRLDDGRIAVVEEVRNYAPDPPARWEPIERTTGEFGEIGDTITEPWLCRPAPEDAGGAEDLGLT